LGDFNEIWYKEMSQNVDVHKRRRIMSSIFKGAVAVRLGVFWSLSSPLS
jgi:hypothetical protein